MTLPLAATLGIAAGGAGSLFGGIGSLFNGSSVQQQQNWQERMMDKQQQYWREQFDLVNEYNKPKNLVSRYLEAGISPSAGFGSSSVGQSSASPTLGGSGSPVGFPPLLPPDCNWQFGAGAAGSVRPCTTSSATCPWWI